MSNTPTNLTDLVTFDWPQPAAFEVYGLGQEIKADTAEELTAKLAAIGIVQTGTVKQPAGTRWKLKEILIGQPKFAGLLGPMYDGPGCCRYETQEVYDFLSQ